jgi:hypothetical protein
MATGSIDRRKRLTEPTKRDAREHWAIAGHYDPDFAEVVQAELRQLGQLQTNWDGYGGQPIDPAVIAAACAFVRSLPENLAFRPRVVPMSPGNLQLEWHAGKKILELEFETPGTIHFLQWHPERDVEEEDTFPAKDIDKAVELIQWFMSGVCV